MAVPPEIIVAKNGILAAIGNLPIDAAADLLQDLLGELRPADPAACTGVTAVWCPVHGDCACPYPQVALQDPDCPLHAPDSAHAGGPE